MEDSSNSNNLKRIYNKTFKFFLFIPVILLIISLVYIYSFYQNTGDFIKKDVSLTGGTTITIYPNTEINLNEFRNFLEKNISDFSLREISNFRTHKQEAVILETPLEPDQITDYIQSFLGYELDSENSSVEFTGAFLSESFYNQLLKAILTAFVLMSIVVFIIFKSPTPSIAIIFSAFADIVMTLALVNFLGIELSSAGIVAFLMLIGYSVDSDIMLTTKVLKHKEGDLDSRIFSSFKTGMTMTLTSLGAIIVALLLTMSFSETLKQIFLILTIGLCFDILNTWLTNTSILKIYMTKKNG